MSGLPIGPERDAAPRPRMPIHGRHVLLEPLSVRHVPELWRAAQGADANWTYLGYGPFTSEDALRANMVVKFSIRGDEWPARRDPILAWLDDANFAPDGTARRPLAAFRAD